MKECLGKTRESMLAKLSVLFNFLYAQYFHNMKLIIQVIQQK